MDIWKRIRMFFTMKAESALNQAEDPRETLDFAYARQREMLTKVKHSLIEVATSRRQLEQQAQKLRYRLPHWEEQAKRALAAGREDLARNALQRKQSCLAELAQLDQQIADVLAEEQKLTLTEQHCSQQLDSFRTRREMLAARFTAAEAQVKLNETLGGMSADSAELSAALERAEGKIETMQARASALDTLLTDSGAFSESWGGDALDRELRALTLNQSMEAEMTRLKGLLTVEDGEGKA